MENEDRARRHAELAEAHIADDDAAGQASLAAYYASRETNELLRRLLSQRSSTPPRPMPAIPPDEPDLPGRERPPLSPPLRPPPPRPGLHRRCDAPRPT